MAKSKMENKKIFVGILLASLLVLGVAPYFSVSAQSCDPDALKSVKMGQRGATVKNVQACLMEAGYDIPAGATGYYGEQTRKAVQAFYADWYGEWDGRSLGPKGVQELKNLLAGGEEQMPPAEQTPPETSQPTPQVPSDVLMQILTLMLAGKTTEAMALLSPYLGGLPLPTTSVVTTTVTTTTTTQPVEEGLTPGVPGYLFAEADPSVSGVIVREGESAKVFGIKFRADSGAVKVTSLVLRWNNNPAAPYRILSRVEVLDESGNVLASKSPSDFLTDSSLNYYLPVSGLNVVVPVNNQKSVFVRVTLVNTLPPGVSGSSTAFSIQSSDVRGVDGTGATISASLSQSPLSFSFTPEATLAGSAQLTAARDSSSPAEGYVFASDVANGRAQNVTALVFNLTTQNDSLRLTRMTGSVSTTTIVERVRVSIGGSNFVANSSGTNWELNLGSAGLVIEKDKSQRVTVAVDLRNAAVTPATFTVSVATTTAQNSLGDTRDYSTQASSNVLSYVRGGPTFVVNSKSLILKSIKDANGNIATTTVDTVSFQVSITANQTDVYIPESSPVYVEVVQPNNVTTATTTLNVSIVNPSGTEKQGGRYRIPRGNTVTFTFTAMPNRNLVGDLTLQAWVKSISWGYDSSGTLNTATFMANDKNTWATAEVQPQ